MVAHDTRRPADPARRLSPDTISLLRDTISAHRSSNDGEEPLRVALDTAAAEARAIGMQPEELIIHLKKIEAEVSSASPAPGNDLHGRRGLREWLVTACLKAYFRN